jgi:uncharacterized membrane protein
VQHCCRRVTACAESVLLLMVLLVLVFVFVFVLLIALADSSSEANDGFAANASVTPIKRTRSSISDRHISRESPSSASDT